MISFGKLIGKYSNSAYYEGTKAFREDSPKEQKSPYEEGSKADKDWLNGYMDAYFLRWL